MTQEDKELLLRDLCARLPYGIKASYYGADEECETWDEVDGVAFDYVEIGQYSLPIERIKPCLFPLSSMTEEQWEDYQKIRMIDWVFGDINGTFINAGLIVDWLNAHHFDYRGLIKKGLAIDATGLNIYQDYDYRSKINIK